jgi:alkaline phosphatase D
VASGDPLPDGAVLWTRLAPKPLEMDGGMPSANVDVTWEVGQDEKLTRAVRKGKAVARPELAHSVHVEIGGLEPERWYWYRFRTGSQESPAGRFRTAPSGGSAINRLRFAFASCQNYTHGLWTAYEHMAAEDLDLVLYLGDYIYEKDYRGTVRAHEAGEPFALPEYRARHAYYKTDPLLQKAHTACPWIPVWDDHEFSNNYVNDLHERLEMTREDFLKRRAAAYQAYYEHMPLRRSALPNGPEMALYRRFDFGKLIRLHMLDTRQYRTDQPCGDGGKPVCEGVRAPTQTVLGPRQEAWLERGLEESRAQWNVLGQQIFFTHQDFAAGPDELYSMDSWNGYQLARERLVTALSREGVSNPVILTGDVHANWVGEVRTDIRDPKSRCVATEFVGTSISSGGDGAEMTPRVEAMLPENPQIRFFNGKRGYVRCEVSPDRWQTDYRTLDQVTKPGGSVRTRATFVVESGNSVPRLDSGA